MPLSSCSSCKNVFFVVFLCVSRACLGNTSVLALKMGLNRHCSHLLLLLLVACEELPVLAARHDLRRDLRLCT